MKNLKFIQQVVEYFNLNQSTVRETAKLFNLSISTVHNYITNALPNPVSRSILERNKAERYIHGGQATKRNFLAKRSK